MRGKARCTAGTPQGEAPGKPDRGRVGVREGSCRKGALKLSPEGRESLRCLWESVRSFEEAENMCAKMGKDESKEGPGWKSSSLMQTEQLGLHLPFTRSSSALWR